MTAERRAALVDDDNWGLGVDLNPDGKFHQYHLDLASSIEYRDLVISVAIEPVAQPRPGEEMAIKSIALSPGGGSSR